MFNNLRELILSMPTDEVCKQYLAQQRWNGKTVCPYCGHNKCYTIEGGKRFKCASNTCYKRFTVTVGTIFESSNIPLDKWFTAIYLTTAHKKGISSYQLGRDISVTQKSAWFMLHRIREMMRNKKPVVLGLNNPVEADETFVGGKFGNMHNSKRKKLNDPNNPTTNKTTVLGMMERGGKLVAVVIPPKNSLQITKVVANTVVNNATLITDSSNVYMRISSGYNHHAVNHSIHEYVKENNIHTNSIEGAFSHFKRMIYGIYHQITSKHTHRYCDEFTYRFNSRKIKDADRFALSISNVEGRLKYKQLIGATAPTVITIPQKPANRYKGVIQLLDGEIIAEFKSIYLANKTTGISKRNIDKVCKGERNSAGGFNWIFA